MPSQVVQILGFCVKSLTMLVTLPLDKEQTAIAECHRLLHIKTTSVWDVAHFMGLLISLFPACPLGCTHYRSLELVKLWGLKNNAGNFNAKCSIS